MTQTIKTGRDIDYCCRAAQSRDEDENLKLAEAGVEHSAKSSGKSQVALEGGAESGALGAVSGITGASPDPELASVIEAWPRLNESAKATIIGIVRHAAENGK